jgi:hypothetical protein
MERSRSIGTKCPIGSCSHGLFHPSEDFSISFYGIVEGKVGNVHFSILSGFEAKAFEAKAFGAITFGQKVTSLAPLVWMKK